MSLAPTRAFCLLKKAINKPTRTVRGSILTESFIVGKGRSRSLTTIGAPPFVAGSNSPAITAMIQSQQRQNTLEKLLQPGSVAVFGLEGPKAVQGMTLLKNLLDNQTPHTRKIYPIHSSVPEVMGLQTFASFCDLTQAPDLAVILSVAEDVPPILKECAEKGVKVVIIMSEGFSESGTEGEEIERELQEAVKGTMTRILGPHSSGVLKPHVGLNATLVHKSPLPGHVGFVFEGGGGSAWLDWSYSRNIGISVFASVGNKLDVGWGEILTLMRDDLHTKSLCLFMESVGKSARSFLSAAREVALKKPIVALHAGKTKEGSLVASHDSGSPSSDDAVLDAAFLRCGILRVGTLNTLYKTSLMLSTQPLPAGPNLAIVTNSGAGGVLATDGLIYNGGSLAPLNEECLRTLGSILPRVWSKVNPVYVGESTGAEDLQKVVAACLQNPETHAVLVINIPRPGISSLDTARAVTETLKAGRKTALTCWMGGSPDVEAAKRYFIEQQIPTFEFPDEAARVFNSVQKYAVSLKSIYETPLDPRNLQEAKTLRVEISRMINNALTEGRTDLKHQEVEMVLKACGISLLPTVVVNSEAEAVAASALCGYPLVMKRRTRTGRQRDAVLGIRDEESLRRAYAILCSSAGKADAGVKMQTMVHAGYEIRLSSRTDPTFGPIIEFGVGSKLGGSMHDVVVGLPPLTSTLARRIMEKTKIYQALISQNQHSQFMLTEESPSSPQRGLDALDEAMVLFSQVISQHPRIKEVSINPLILFPDNSGNLVNLMAIEAEIILHESSVEDNDIPQAAILPYPQHLVRHARTKNGQSLEIRPIRPEDEPLMVKFHNGLSGQSVRLRFFQNLRLAQRIKHDRLCRLCFIDYTQEMALVAVDGGGNIVGVGRLYKLTRTNDAEYAILVHDSWQNTGVGSILMESLIHVCSDDWDVDAITGDVLIDNDGMKGLCRRFNFAMALDPEEGILKVRLDLRSHKKLRKQ